MAIHGQHSQLLAAGGVLLLACAGVLPVSGCTSTRSQLTPALVMFWFNRRVRFRALLRASSHGLWRVVSGVVPLLNRCHYAWEGRQAGREARQC